MSQAIAQALLDLDERICAVEPADVDFLQRLVAQRAELLRRLLEHPEQVEAPLVEALKASQRQTEKFLRDSLEHLGDDLRNLHKHSRARQRYLYAGREDLRYE